MTTKPGTPASERREMALDCYRALTHARASQMHISVRSFLWGDKKTAKRLKRFWDAAQDILGEVEKTLESEGFEDVKDLLDDHAAELVKATRKYISDDAETQA